MKTLGRILIILAVFSVLAGLMVLGVNASGGSTSALDGAPSQLRPGGDSNQFRPEGDQNRPDRGERGGAGGSRWMFGVIKNVGVMALLVTVIAWPKSIAKKKKKQAGIKSANGEA
jgi:hypothetical protein